MAPKGGKQGGRGNGGRTVTNQGKKTVTKSRRGGAKQSVATKTRSKQVESNGNQNRSSRSKGRGGRNPRGRGRVPKAKREEKKPVTAEELDSAMDDYWLKSEKKEVAAKKLDEEMDAYWEKKNQDKNDNASGDDTAEEKPDPSTGDS
jgi:hypothetical protein